MKRPFWTFAWRITAAHTIAYFVAGIFALVVFRYDEIFGSDSLAFMRPVDSPWVAAGPGLQLIRGLLLSFFLYPFRMVFFETDRGWVKFWALSFGLSYLSTIAAAPGSFEGFIYTDLPIRYHIIGVPELVLYLTLFTSIVFGWYARPGKAFTIASILSVSLIVLMSLMGVLAAFGMIDTTYY